MTRSFRLYATTAGMVLLAGCSGQPTPPALVIAPPRPAPVPVLVAQMPKGASPTTIIPTPFADGSYPTPNRVLTQAATIWHLRVGLNVAALACRGPQEAAIVAGYNALLTTHKAALVTAEATYAAEYRKAGGDWRDRYDDAMTRLYNFFSQSTARDEFCAAAGAVLAEAQAVPAADLTGFAQTRLVRLDRPFTDFYRAVDVWRGRATARPAVAYAQNGYGQNGYGQTGYAPRPVAARPNVQVSVPVPAAIPRLSVDQSVLGGR
ncbi:hypothetical protein [Sphingomonas sp. Leaf17]|uniref:hypothetical protein n=1 Tax=Sphingomonas sp. Leaf17 TaxID=1735683 RepID=UPI000AC395C9|nr:hypothetical protein [Sphingomonas sp. Leaf17]